MVGSEGYPQLIPTVGAASADLYAAQVPTAKSNVNTCHICDDNNTLHVMYSSSSSVVEKF